MGLKFCPFTFLLLLFVCIRLQYCKVEGKVCTRGWFGDDCDLKCHCKGGDYNCNVNGSCSTGCHKDYMGPKCQYVIAGSWFAPGLVETGEGIQCKEHNYTEIEVTMNRPIAFRWMRIWTDSTDSGIDYPEPPEVKINFIFRYWCSKSYIRHVDINVMDLHCIDVRTPATTITIQSDTSNHWCKVLVSGGRNVALKKKQEDIRAPSHMRLPLNGVDGDEHNCSRRWENKENDHSFFPVKFPHPVDVHWVKITLDAENSWREDQNYGPRYVLELKRAEGRSCSHLIRGSNYVRNTAHCRDVSEFRLTKVVEQNDYFSKIGMVVCELQIMAECPLGRTGWKCDIPCMCGWENPVCGQYDQCEFDCAEGYKGPLCTQKCEQGTYGRDCSRTCSEACNSTCQFDTGECDSPCIGSFKDPQCQLSFEASTSTVQDKRGSLIVHTSLFLIICAILGTIIAVLCSTMPGERGTHKPVMREAEGNVVTVVTEVVEEVVEEVVVQEVEKDSGDGDERD